MAVPDHPLNSLTERTIGAAIEVHRQLGPGLLESNYQSCLVRELELRSIAFQEFTHVPVIDKGAAVGRRYVVDLVIEGGLIVELKAAESLLPVHSAQLLTYMKLMNLSAGLLINFNVPVLVNGIRRLTR